MAENMWYYIIDSMKAIILSMMSFFHHNMYDASFFYLKVFDSTWVLRKIMEFFAWQSKICEQIISRQVLNDFQPNFIWQLHFSPINIVFQSFSGIL